MLDKGELTRLHTLRSANQLKRQSPRMTHLPSAANGPGGLCKREGERERACNEIEERLPEVEPTEDTCHRDLKDKRVDESTEESLKKAVR